MKANEINILKAVTTYLTPDTLLLATYMYHSNPEDRKSSQYRYEVRIAKKSELEAEIADLDSDAKKLTPFCWPTVPDKIVLIDNSTNCAKASSWLRIRVKKAVPWEKYLKILDGWKYRAGKIVEQNLNARWHTTEFTAQGDPTLYDITDKDKMLSLVGKHLSHICVSKRYPPKPMA